MYTKVKINDIIWQTKQLQHHVLKIWFNYVIGRLALSDRGTSKKKKKYQEPN